MYKKLAAGVGILIAIAHIGVLGHLGFRREPDRPLEITLPEAGEFSSYSITATPEGYSIEYIGNDPRVLTQETETTRSGFLGRNTETRVIVEYTQDGTRNIGDVEVLEEGKLSAEQVACIEAAGGGRSSGALVGTSIAASAIPFVSGIPYVGWLASGWVAMFGSDIGGSVGAEISTLIKDC